MKTGLRGLIPIFVLVCLIFAVGGCGLGSDEQIMEEEEQVTVERGSLVSSIAAVGSVRARNEVLLSFDTSGRVSEVQVEAGEEVEADQVLAQLNVEDLELQVRNAEAALAVSRAQLDQLNAGPRPEEVVAAQAQVKAMQAALDQATAQRDQLLAGATEAEIASAQAAVKSARANYARVQAGPSAEEVAVAQAALDSAQAAMEQAQAAFDPVKDRPEVGMLPESLVLRNATIEMERAQANYDALMNHPTTAELAAAAAQAAQAEAQLAE